MWLIFEENPIIRHFRIIGVLLYLHICAQARGSVSPGRYRVTVRATGLPKTQDHYCNSI
jgi:hypothetical protein